MKHILLQSAIVCAALFSAGGLRIQADCSPAHELLREVDTEIMLEEYRTLRSQIFGLQIDLAVHRAELSHSLAQSEGAEIKLAIAEAQLDALQQLAETKRDQILDLHAGPHGDHHDMDETHDEAVGEAMEGPEHGDSDDPWQSLQGRWLGSEVGYDAQVQMTIEDRQIRFRNPDRGEWYVGRVAEWRATDRDQEFHFDFIIDECVAPQYVGKTSKALVRMGEDRIALAGNEPGQQDRPKAFERQGGTRVFSFKRLLEEQ